MSGRAGDTVEANVIALRELAALIRARGTCAPMAIEVIADRLAALAPRPINPPPVYSKFIGDTPQGRPVEGVVPFVQSTAPERIWLAVSDSASDADHVFPHDAEEVGWSHDEPLEVCVPYVRADLNHPAPAPEVDDAMVERAARGICALRKWDPDARVKYSGTNKFCKNRDGSYTVQWQMHRHDARAALIGAIGATP